MVRIIDLIKMLEEEKQNKLKFKHSHLEICERDHN